MPHHPRPRRLLRIARRYTGRGCAQEDLEQTRVVLDPALARLGPAERQLLQLRFVEERSQRDIAGALGVG